MPASNAPLRFFAVFCVTLSVLVVCSPAVSGAVYDNDVTITILPNESSYYNEQYDLSNESDLEQYINSARVYDDLDGVSGTYYGPLFRPGEFQYYYSWTDEPNNLTWFTDPGNYLSTEWREYVYMLDVNIMNVIGPDIIMNGVSEWWIDIPVQPNEAMIYEYDYPDVYDYPCTHSWLSSTFKFELTDRSGQEIEFLEYPEGPGYLNGVYSNDHFYVYMPIPMFSCIDNETAWSAWNITFSLGMCYSDPVFYISNEVIGRHKVFDWDQYIMGHEPVALFNGEIADNSTDIGFEGIRINDWDNPSSSDSNVFNNSLRYLPATVSLGHSYIFVQGLGKHGLFGKTFQFSGRDNLYKIEDDVVIINEFTVPHSITADQYFSFYLPFICDKLINISQIRVTLHNGVKFVGGSSIWLWDIDVSPFPSEMNYTDFILFSTNVKVNISTLNANRKITYTVDLAFNTTEEITFLFHWFQDPINFSIYPHVNNLFHKVKEFTPEEWCYGVVQHTAWLTGGQWGQFGASPTGLVPIGWYFPKYVYVSNFTYNMSFTSGISESRIVYDSSYYFWMAGKSFESFLYDPLEVEHLINAVRYSLVGTAMAFYDGAQTLYGFIKTGFESIWADLQYIGEWLWKGICKIYEMLISLGQFIQDNLVPILEIGMIVIVIWSFLFVFGAYATIYKRFALEGEH